MPLHWSLDYKTPAFKGNRHFLYQIHSKPSQGVDLQSFICDSKVAAGAHGKLGRVQCLSREVGIGAWVGG